MRPEAVWRRAFCDPAGRRPGGLVFPVRVAAVCLAVWAASEGASRAQPGPPPSFQDEIEASFVYTVAKFVDWPSGAFEEPGSPLVFVILGDDPVQSSLLKTVTGKRIAGRPIEVVGVRSRDDLIPCHVLFVGRSEAGRVDEVIERMRGESVLTVGDFERFAQRGGVLRLSLEENMVRFEVNVDAAERAHLRISSKILKLGKVIRDKRRAQGSP